MKCNRIVVAVDFSEHSIAAVQWVAQHFAPRAELVLVHVLELPPPPSFWPRRVWLRADDIETYRMGAKTRLRQLGLQIGRGLLWEEVRLGRPEDEVLRVAAEYEADLIVAGSHRERTGFWNRFGSTAERILGGAEVPVLIVHGAPRGVVADGVLHDRECSCHLAPLISVSNILKSRYRGFEESQGLPVDLFVSSAEQSEASGDRDAIARHNSG